MGDVIYVTQPSGARFKACACIRDSWPTINKLARLKGYIRQQIDVTQGGYSTSVNASALTHAGGGVLDTMVTGAQLDALLEECGIAAYERTEADGFKPHSHILWIGCPHLHAQAAAQVTSWRNLRNGLRSNTLDRDKTRPSPIRNWEQGLAWATAQLAQLEDDIMTPEQEKRIIAAINAAATVPITAQVGRELNANGGPLTLMQAIQSVYWDSKQAAQSAVALLSASDIDEKVLAQAMAALVAPVVRDAVVAAVTAGGSPQVIADAVVARFGAALNGYPKEEQV